MSFTEVHPQPSLPDVQVHPALEHSISPVTVRFLPLIRDQCFQESDGTIFRKLLLMNSVSEDLPVLFCYKSISVLNRGTEPGEQIVRTQMSVRKPVPKLLCVILTPLSEEKGRCVT